MYPLGLGGSKSLADIFSDAKVPRSIRDQLPIITCGGHIVWVAGVAFDERFKVRITDQRGCLGQRPRRWRVDCRQDERQPAG